MSETERSQILAAIAYADAMRSLGAKINRIGFPILRNGTIIGINFYRGYHGRAMIELNPDYIWHRGLWTQVWIEFVNGEWVFDQSSYREEFLAEHFPDQYPEPHSDVIDLPYVPEKGGVKVIDLPL